MKKLLSFQHFGIISIDSRCPAIEFLKLVYFFYIYCHENSKIKKPPIFLMTFSCQKQFFEKIITGQARELIVLNPFLDSFCNSAFKNISLTPGIPKGCFQQPQDVVWRVYNEKYLKKKNMERLMPQPINFSQKCKVYAEVKQDKTNSFHLVLV